MSSLKSTLFTLLVIITASAGWSASDASVHNSCTEIHGESNTYSVDRMESEIIAGIQSSVSIVKPVYNAKVRSYLVTYLEKHREHTERIIGRSELYFPLFEKYLEAYGLPTDLKYLAIIESGLEPAATSYVGAAGLWQFMRGTGIWLGLRITKYIDERRDPEKSTEAAVRYLRDLYSDFGSWELALSAYNAGPGRVNYAIRRAGSRDYWKLQRFLPRETRAYVPGFIAANYLFSNYTKHDLSPESLPDEFHHTVDIPLYDGISFTKVNAVTGVSMSTLSRLNPKYSRRYVPRSSKGYSLRIPAHAVRPFLDHLGVDEDQVDSLITDGIVDIESLPVIIGFEERAITETYRVKKGDNLYTLARKYGCSVNDIMRWNGLSNSNLAINQRLKIETKERIAIYQEVEKPSRSIAELPAISSIGLLQGKFNYVIANLDDKRISPDNKHIKQSVRNFKLGRRMSVSDALVIYGLPDITSVENKAKSPGDLVYISE